MVEMSSSMMIARIKGSSSILEVVRLATALQMIVKWEEEVRSVFRELIRRCNSESIFVQVSVDDFLFLELETVISNRTVAGEGGKGFMAQRSVCHLEK
jgi:hypothetical protein